MGTPRRVMSWRSSTVKPFRSKKRRASSLASVNSRWMPCAYRGLDRVVQPRGDAAAGRLGRAEKAVDVPVGLQVDERDHMARFVRGHQYQTAITGTAVFPLGVPASGNPGPDLFRRVIRQRHFADGTVEDIGHAGGVLPLVGPDGYLHHQDTIRQPPGPVRRSGGTQSDQAEPAEVRTARSFDGASSTPGLESAWPRRAARHLDEQDVLPTPDSVPVTSRAGWAIRSAQNVQL